MDSDYRFIKEFKQLQHKCVRWSNMKMSRLYIRNQPVRLKNIRLGTQALVTYTNYAGTPSNPPAIRS